jgi:hypothetical protein
MKKNLFVEKSALPEDAMKERVNSSRLMEVLEEYALHEKFVIVAATGMRPVAEGRSWTGLRPGSLK